MLFHMFEAFFAFWFRIWAKKWEDGRGASHPLQEQEEKCNNCGRELVCINEAGPLVKGLLSRVGWGMCFPMSRGQEIKVKGQESRS